LYFDSFLFIFIRNGQPRSVLNVLGYLYFQYRHSSHYYWIFQKKTSTFATTKGAIWYLVATNFYGLEQPPTNKQLNARIFNITHGTFVFCSWLIVVHFISILCLKSKNKLFA